MPKLREMLIAIVFPALAMVALPLTVPSFPGSIAHACEGEIPLSVNTNTTKKSKKRVLNTFTMYQFRDLRKSSFDKLAGRVVSYGFAGKLRGEEDIQITGFSKRFSYLILKSASFNRRLINRWLLKMHKLKTKKDRRAYLESELKKQKNLRTNLKSSVKKFKKQVKDLRGTDETSRKYKAAVKALGDERLLLANTEDAINLANRWKGSITEGQIKK